MCLCLRVSNSMASSSTTSTTINTTTGPKGRNLGIAKGTPRSCKMRCLLRLGLSLRLRLRTHHLRAANIARVPADTVTHTSTVEIGGKSVDTITRPIAFLSLYRIRGLAVERATRRATRRATKRRRWKKKDEGIED